MLNDDILVSICCLSYNHKKFIKDALDSFLAQETNFKYEILINDDASTDGSIEILKEYESAYPDVIKVRYHTENQYSKGITNPSGVFNFPRARGKYIALCECDDYFIDKNKLQKQFEYMEANPNCSLCFHSAKIQKMDSSLVDKLVRPYTRNTKIKSEDIIDKTKGYPTASLFFRAEFVKELPKFYFKCMIGDIPLQIILANYGYAYYIDEAMSVYRVGDSGSWSNMQKEGDYELKQEKYFINMQNMYHSFDEFSNYKYSKSVESAIRRIRFLTFVNTRKYYEIFASYNKKYYKELSIKDRFFIRLEYFFPVIYKLLQTVYRR